MSAAALTPLYTREAIAARVGELAAEISRQYRGEPLVAVCVLKGAVIFFADLVRQIDNAELRLDFVRLASYGEGSVAGRLRFERDLETDIRDRHVLVVEDVVDSGRTMAFLLKTLAARGPRSLRLVALVDKRERREAPVRVDFPGFCLDRGFIVGYGLDYAELYRALPDICVAEPRD